MGRQPVSEAVFAAGPVWVDNIEVAYGYTGECWLSYIGQKGELLLTQDEPETEVEADPQQAIAIARQQEAKSLELWATVSLARLWQPQGKKEEARKMLAEIYGWFTEGFEWGSYGDMMKVW